MADKQRHENEFWPDYEVVPVQDEIEVRKAKYVAGGKNADGKTIPGAFDYTMETVKGGWLVCFPRRHSVLFRNDAQGRSEMVRLGFASWKDKKGGDIEIETPAVTDHDSGMRVSGNSRLMSLAAQITAQGVLKRAGRISTKVGKHVEE